MRGAIILLGFLLLAMMGYAADLVPCPDCDQPVSPRAIMCPHCGCPGDAIAEYVAATEVEKAAPPVYPVAELKADSADGWAVGYTDGAGNFLVMDAHLLAAATTLAISPITTNAPVAYQQMQIGTKTPLVRFRTPSTNISFLVVARSLNTAEDKMLHLHADGRTTPADAGSAPDRGVVGVTDSRTNLVGIARHVDGKTSILLLPEGREEWKDITPGDFRDQTRLLTVAARAIAEGTTVPREIMEQMGKTDWATTYFKQESNRILRKKKKGGTP